MQTLALGRFHKGLVRLLIVPGHVCCTGFHGRENVNQSGVVAPMLYELANALFLAHFTTPSHELNFHTMSLSHSRGILSYQVS